MPDIVESVVKMFEIANWETHFEIAQSRKSAARHRWVAIPNDHGGRGYKRIMREKNALEIFAVWIVMVQLASRAPRRGVLADEKGMAYTFEDMSLYTDFPIASFEAATPFLLKIGWLCRCDSNALPPRYHHATSTVATTVQDKTIPNNTKQNNTTELSIESKEYVSSPEKHSARSEVDAAWARIPQHRQVGIGSFRTAWVREITRTDVDPELVGDKLEEYYQSERGRGEFARNPVTLIDEEFWMEHPSAWRTNKMPTKFTESSFDHGKIVKNFCGDNEERIALVKKLQSQGLNVGRIAYKIHKGLLNG